MSEEEVWAFIEQQKSMQVATLNRDGTVHLTTLWFAIVDGALVFETFTKSQKIKNLERDPRVAILFEDGVEYGKLRGVSINAIAEVYSTPEKVHELARHVMIRNNPEVPRESLDEAAKQLASKRSAVVIRPEKLVSWDHGKLGGGY